MGDQGGRVSWKIRQAIGGVSVGSYVECLHPGEFVPLFLGVLVATDVFPGESKGESAFDLDDLVDHIVFGTEGSACESGDSREAGSDAFDESLVVSCDAEPWFRFWWKSGSGDVLEAVEGDVCFQKDQ